VFITDQQRRVVIVFLFAVGSAAFAAHLMVVLSPPLFIGSLIVLVAIGAILLSPATGLYLYVFVEAFRSIDHQFFDEGLLSGARIIILVTIVSFAVRVLVPNIIPFAQATRTPLTIIDRSLFVFTFLSIVSSLRSASTGLLHTISFVSLYSLYFITRNIIKDWRILQRLVDVWIVATLALIVYELNFAIEDFALLGAGNPRRIGGEFGNPNGMALWLLLLLGPLFQRYFTSEGIAKRALNFTLLGIVSTFLLLTGSRGGWLAGITILVLSIMFIKPRQAMGDNALEKRRKFGLKSISTIITVFVFFFVLVQLFNPVIERRLIGLQGDDLDTRLNDLQASLNLFYSSPIIGVGIGSNYRYEIELLMRNPETLIDGAPNSPHNLYTGLLAQQGMIGVITFGIFLVITIQQYTRLTLRYADSRYSSIPLGFAASMVGYLVFAATHAALMYNMVWFVFGAFSAAVELLKDEKVTDQV